MSHEEGHLTVGGNRGVVSDPGPGTIPGIKRKDSHSWAQRTPLTLSEAAVHMNVTERFMRRLVAEHRIAYLKVGRFIRFDPLDLDTYLASCRVLAVETHPSTRR